MAESSSIVPETKMNGTPGAISRASSSAWRPLNCGSVQSAKIRSNSSLVQVGNEFLAVVATDDIALDAVPEQKLVHQLAVGLRIFKVEDAEFRLHRITRAQWY